MNTHNDERNKKYYISMLEMLKCYKEHLEERDYKDKQELLDKILHTQQNIASCLAAVYDREYINEQLKVLKKEKTYPYKFRVITLKSAEPLVRRLLTFLLPIEPFFWMYHWAYIIHDKKRK